MYIVRMDLLLLRKNSIDFRRESFLSLTQTFFWLFGFLAGKKRRTFSALFLVFRYTKKVCAEYDREREREGD